MRFVLKTHYGQDIDLFQHNGQRFWYGLLLAVLCVAPFLLGNFYIGELSHVFIFAIAGLGLMLLVGYTGLFSLGHAAFLAIGAYAHAVLLSHGVPFFLSVLISVVFSGLVGAAVGVAALRMTGVYLAIATLAFAFVVDHIIIHLPSVTGGNRGFLVPDPAVFGVSFITPVRFYFLCLITLVASLLLVMNLLRSPTGRSFIAVRDSEISAQAMGVNLLRAKTTSFALSASITGLAGALYSHQIGYLFPGSFTLSTSIELLMIVVVGGVGSLHGVIFGAIFVRIVPQVIALLRDTLPEVIALRGGLESFVFGAIIILFLIFEPLGIYGRWIKIRTYFTEFPLYRRATYKRQRSYLRTERVR